MKGGSPSNDLWPIAHAAPIGQGDVMEQARLFVYGSLLSGMHNHARLTCAQLIGPRKTRPEFALVDLGWYPGLIPGAESVEGELYALDARLLPELDEFEGRHEYRRMTTELQDGESAEIYLYVAPLEGTEPPVGASWRAYLAQRPPRP